MNSNYDHSQKLTMYIARQLRQIYTHTVAGEYCEEEVVLLRSQGYDVLVYYELDMMKYPTIQLILDFLTTYGGVYQVQRFAAEFVSIGCTYIIDHFEKICIDGGLQQHWKKKGEITMLINDVDDQILLTHMQCAYPEYAQDFMTFFYEVGASLFHYCSYEQVVPCTRNWYSPSNIARVFFWQNYIRWIELEYFSLYDPTKWPSIKNHIDCITCSVRWNMSWSTPLVEWVFVGVVRLFQTWSCVWGLFLYGEVCGIWLTTMDW
jgi:hypothetical protein